MKKIFSLFSVIIMICLAFAGNAMGATEKAATHKAAAKAPAISKESKDCIACHREENPGVYGPWATSAHAKHGVACYECHKADKSRKDAQEHNGYTIGWCVM